MVVLGAVGVVGAVWVCGGGGGAERGGGGWSCWDSLSFGGASLFFGGKEEMRAVGMEAWAWLCWRWCGCVKVWMGGERVRVLGAVGAVGWGGRVAQVVVLGQQ